MVAFTTAPPNSVQASEFFPEPLHVIEISVSLPGMNQSQSYFAIGIQSVSFGIEPSVGLATICFFPLEG
jgi:hypothetical protein